MLSSSTCHVPFPLCPSADPNLEWLIPSLAKRPAVSHPRLEFAAAVLALA